MKGLLITSTLTMGKPSQGQVNLFIRGPDSVKSQDLHSESVTPVSQGCSIQVLLWDLAKVELSGRQG